ncbi:protease, putative [Ixodes scapularis]|uniref:Protease, putative n=1 Tax=Ixodes scapularis TaxID=6945 RepID=B7QDY5_IXOSC|nr:protease, putative [Ixodes scapularis]|eukprot:XP_002413749.1 protease, putative [Ixodes scapularis]
MTKMGLTENDPHSFAHPDKCVVTHLHLDVEIDFERKILVGFVDLTCEKRSQDANSLVLDTQDLNIKRVTHSKTGKELEYDASTVDPIFGTKLEIQLPSSMETNSAQKKLGPRCTVWAEKEFVDLAVIDFEDTELMLTTAESLVGDYVWGVYDLLVLPPSFPYGGMENPCLTFVTPTLLAGDKSLASVIAHEIAHSWTGNLVTNRTFEHFWLNEGFTMFLERKIIGRMFGDDTRQFQALGGVEDLLYAVETLGAESPLTSLVPPLRGVHPDEAFSSIPYEKGHTFLYYLEELLGGPDVFNPFLKSYIEKFKYKSVDTWQWKEYLLQYFKDKEDVLSTVDWKAWLHGPGLPPTIPSYRSESVKQCEDLCKRWADPDADESEFSSRDVADFKPRHTELFLSFLLREKPLSNKRIALLTQLYKMEQVGNSEIKFRWLRLGLCAKWEPIVPHVTKFLREVGRMKFVCPLFRDLHAWEDQRPLSTSLFLELKPRMMHVVVCKLAKDLAISS